VCVRALRSINLKSISRRETNKIESNRKGREQKTHSTSVSEICCVVSFRLLAKASQIICGSPERILWRRETLRCCVYLNLPAKGERPKILSYSHIRVCV
jgi:hypothetical protein